MKKKYLPLILIPLMSLSLFACDGPNNPPKPPVPPENLHSYDDLVYNVEHLGFATGAESPENTQVNYGVGGCDLGFPVYVKEKNQFQFYFGDTFTNQNQQGMWRSNTIGYCSDTEDFDDGITLDFIASGSGMAKFAVNGHHSANGELEVTKIPTGLIDIDGTIYMFYFSMFDWNAPKDNCMNYGGVVKSTDYGQTWQRVYDLTWVNTASNNTTQKIQSLINEDANNLPNGGFCDITTHGGFDATQIYPVDGKDGYIYLFCEGGYRNHGPKLGRVLKEKFEIFEEYEYFIGQYDAQGNAMWKKGKQGLAFIRGKSGCELVPNSFGEMSAFYNAYLKKWCMMTCTGASTMMFMSSKITGPYSKSCRIFPGSAREVIPEGSIYAPMSIEEMQKENGKVMYLLCSTWMPHYNPSLIKVTFK